MMRTRVVAATRMAAAAVRPLTTTGTTTSAAPRTSPPTPTSAESNARPPRTWGAPPTTGGARLTHLTMPANVVTAADLVKGTKPEQLKAVVVPFHLAVMLRRLVALNAQPASTTTPSDNETSPADVRASIGAVLQRTLEVASGPSSSSSFLEPPFTMSILASAIARGNLPATDAPVSTDALALMTFVGKHTKPERLDPRDLALIMWAWARAGTSVPRDPFVPRVVAEVNRRAPGIQTMEPLAVVQILWALVKLRVVDETSAFVDVALAFLRERVGLRRIQDASFTRLAYSVANIDRPGCAELMAEVAEEASRRDMATLTPQSVAMLMWGLAKSGFSSAPAGTTAVDKLASKVDSLTWDVFNLPGMASTTWGLARSAHPRAKELLVKAVPRIVATTPQEKSRFYVSGFAMLLEAYAEVGEPASDLFKWAAAELGSRGLEDVKGAPPTTFAEWTSIIISFVETGNENLLRPVLRRASQAVRAAESPAAAAASVAPAELEALRLALELVPAGMVDGALRSVVSPPRAPRPGGGGGGGAGADKR